MIPRWYARQRQSSIPVLTWLSRHQRTTTKPHRCQYSEIRRRWVWQLTLEDVATDVRAVDVTGDVERDWKQRKETCDEQQLDRVGLRSTTRQHVIPQLASITHLSHVHGGTTVVTHLLTQPSTTTYCSSVLTDVSHVHVGSSLLAPFNSTSSHSAGFLLYSDFRNKKQLKNVGTISYCEPPLHCQSPDVASRTPAIPTVQAVCDVHDNNDNAWQRGPLWRHGMGPIKDLSTTTMGSGITL